MDKLLIFKSSPLPINNIFVNFIPKYFFIRTFFEKTKILRKKNALNVQRIEFNFF